MVDPKVVAVVQARLGSSRLPGKVLADLGGRPVLSHLLETARACEMVDEVVVAVPEHDDALVELGNNLGLRVVTGDENDVLARYQRAAEASDATIVVRLTGDCPLLDSFELGAAIRRFGDDTDYLSVEEFPRGTADIEIMTRSALEAAHSQSTDPWHREHVCTFFGDNPDQFRVRIDGPPPALARSEYRLCVDQPEDLEVVREVHRRLAGEAPRVAAMIQILDEDPDLAAINSQVRQVSRPS